MKYALVRNEPNAQGKTMYVRPAGSQTAYTINVRGAQKFPDKATAKADACGNEIVLEYNDG